MHARHRKALGSERQRNDRRLVLPQHHSTSIGPGMDHSNKVSSLYRSSPRGFSFPFCCGSCAGWPPASPRMLVLFLILGASCIICGAMFLLPSSLLRPAPSELKEHEQSRPIVDGGNAPSSKYAQRYPTSSSQLREHGTGLIGDSRSPFVGAPRVSAAELDQYAKQFVAQVRQATGLRKGWMTGTHAWWDCDAMIKKLKPIDDGPFARGYSRAAWRVSESGRATSGHDMVLKRPANGSRTREYASACRQELKFVVRLGLKPFFSRLRGACLDGEPHRRAVAHARLGGALLFDGPFLPWREAVQSPDLLWSGRLRLATQLAELVAELAGRGLIHCDWKPDQVAVEPLGVQVRLVDFKSLRAIRTTSGTVLSPEGVVVKQSGRPGGEQPSGAAPDSVCSDSAQCTQQCFRWTVENGFPLTDGVCERPDEAPCPPLDGLTMVESTVHMFLVPLLLRHAAAVEGEQSLPQRWRQSIETILDSSTVADRSLRRTPHELLEGLEQLQQTFRAQDHFHANMVDMTQSLANLNRQSIQKGLKRCKNEYYC